MGIWNFNVIFSALHRTLPTQFQGMGVSWIALTVSIWWLPLWTCTSQALSGIYCFPVRFGDLLKLKWHTVQVCNMRQLILLWVQNTRQGKRRNRGLKRKVSSKTVTSSWKHNQFLKVCYSSPLACPFCIPVNLEQGFPWADQAAKF